MRRSYAELLFNAAPGTMRPILRIDGGKLVIVHLWQTYKASGTHATVRPALNAPLDKIAGTYLGRLHKAGHVVVPANGWYEWTGEKPNKLPWHVHRADGKLLYMAALTAWGAPGDNKMQQASPSSRLTRRGMIDVHDRRPVVFTPDGAATWMVPELSGEQAAGLARSVALGPDKFAWYQVSTAVGNSRNQGPALAAPLVHGLFD